jgi:hypothetical protein
MTHFRCKNGCFVLCDLSYVKRGVNHGSRDIYETQCRVINNFSQWDWWKDKFE